MEERGKDQVWVRFSPETYHITWDNASQHCQISFYSPHPEFSPFVLVRFHQRFHFKDSGGIETERLSDTRAALGIRANCSLFVI